jgi:alcohol dehydrogenase
MGRHCPRRTVLGIVKHPGAFRELIDLPESNLMPVPRAIPTEQAVFTEPLAAACEILEQVKIPAGEPVAVLGDGKLGLLIAQVLQLHGARVQQFGRHAEKLRIAAATGVKTVISNGSLPKSEYRLTVEATGSAEGLRQAVAMTRPRGTVVMKSTVHGDVVIDTAPVIVNEISLVGSRCGRFQPALRLLASGRLNLEPMIAARFPLRQAAEGFARAATKGVLKVLLTA